jgi:hypothetical protein
MRVLAVSHSCVTDVNQQLYVSLRRLPGVHVELVVPEVWKSDYSGALQRPSLLPELGIPVHHLPVSVPGHVSLHFYRRGLAKAILAAAPDIVFADEEPWSLPLAQLAPICARLGVPLVCYTKQNIWKRYPAPFSWIEQRTYRRAAAIIALSEEVQAVLRAKGFRGPCPILAHGCDLALFHPQPSEAGRAALGLHGTVIGYMAGW